MRFLLSAVLVFFSSLLLAEPATLQIRYETTPIPPGTDTTDDPAVWVHPTVASRSLILGVSKNTQKDGGLSGLGLYSLVPHAWTGSPLTSAHEMPGGAQRDGIDG